MGQREFPFFSTMPPPDQAPPTAVAMCASEAQALRVAMRHRGKRASSWFANQLDVSRSYFSEIATGKKPIPDWMIVPLCVLTGTNLLAQYRQWQRAMRIAAGTEPAQSVEDRIAAELLRRVA